MSEQKSYKVFRISKEVEDEISTDDFKPNGTALAFASTSSRQELIRMSLKSAAFILKQTANTAKNMKEIRHLDEDTVVGDIDSDLRDYLIKLANKIEWLSNCSTIRGDMKEFHDFDKFELDNKSNNK